MQKIKIPTKIPKSLYRYFWDVNVKKLNPSEKYMFVINRLLDKGNLDAARFVVKNYHIDDIRKTFETIRDFNVRVGTFWSTILDIPVTKVKCLNPHYLKMRRQLWPY